MTVSSRLLVIAATVLALVGTAEAQDPEWVQVDWLDGRRQSGHLEFLSDSEICFRVAGGDDGERQRVVASTSQIARVRWSHRPTAADSQPMQELRDGSRFRGRVEQVTDEHVVFDTRWHGPPGSHKALQVPLEQVRFVGLHPPAIRPAIDDDAVQRLIDEETPEDDAVIMVGNAQVAVIRCIVLGVTRAWVKLYWNDKEYMLERAKVWGIRLAAAPDDEPLADGTGFMQIGRDERLYGQSFLRTPGTQENRTKVFYVNRPDGVRWEVSYGYVSEVVYASQRSLDLTTLAPAGFESETLLGRSWPMRLGTSVRGQPLRIGREEFIDGIGCHAPARITYDIPAGYGAFAATVGVDAAAPGPGSVIFRVLDGDGNELARSPLMTAGAKQAQIVATLNGARRIVLVAESADNLDVGDHANWCDPRLIRGN